MRQHLLSALCPLCWLRKRLSIANLPLAFLKPVSPCCWKHHSIVTAYGSISKLLGILALYYDAYFWKTSEKM